LGIIDNGFQSLLKPYLLGRIRKLLITIRRSNVWPFRGLRSSIP
jgi:hypothetical protein